AGNVVAARVVEEPRARLGVGRRGDERDVPRVDAPRSPHLERVGSAVTAQEQWRRRPPAPRAGRLTHRMKLAARRIDAAMELPSAADEAVDAEPQRTAHVPERR